MKSIMRKTLVLAAVLSLAGCTQTPEDQTPEKQETVSYSISHEPEFGGVYIEIGIDDFNALGFSYGDSVDVRFSNGYVLEDIPYYNGYYVDAGQPLLIAYPGYEYIKAAVNYGNDLWETANLKLGENSGENEEKTSLWLNADLEEHDTAEVELREKGKYLDVQQARDIHYYDEREKYDSDAMFANFRPMNIGSLKENFFCRSASPCDNQHKRAPYVDRLMEEAGVKAILNLSDSETKIDTYIARDGFDSPYFLSLYEGGTVFPVSLSMNYTADEFAEKIVQGFTQLAQAEGPYLVHCTEGKDRTGFVCMIIEMLAGAPYQDIADDYMITYANYYRIDRQSDPARYQTILEKNLDAMMSFVTSEPPENLTRCDLVSAAENWLLSHGMKKEDLELFTSKILR